ncbi:Di-sulfide bridge nucleocytoplasmic transport domain-containing protein [Thamnidium elegans]|nr:Di-sulfide bridge nucleocytoplasmic transport domain-containing protein [Thamnidium elegans]
MSCNDRPVKKRKIQNTNEKEMQIKTSFRNYTSFLASPDAPIILSTYIKLVLHATGILIILFIFYQLIRSCTQEIQDRYDSELREFEDKTRTCHYNYISNDCGPDLKGTYWQTFCDEWDRCRNLQPQFIGKSKIATQVFGELMNGFVEPLTLKAMVIICLLVFGFFIISSFVVL